MATTRAAEFDTLDVELAEMAKALGHPARIAILRVLAQRDTCICGEIVDKLPLAQATVSQHLKALKAAGLIQGEVEGPRSCYCLDREKLQRARDTLGSLFTSLFSAADCC